MIKETMTYEEFKQMSQNLNASDVEIAVAAAFAGEGFEAVDCRDLADVWDTLQRVVRGEDIRSNFMDEAYERLYMQGFRIGDTEWSDETAAAQAQEWAALILRRIYEVGDE